MKKLLILFLMCIFFREGLSDSVGSEALVSVVGYTNFPQNPILTQNIMYAFGWMRDGFGLANINTTCTFQSVFPVSSRLSLHGGQMTLATDFIMNNNITFLSPGIVWGNSHIFDIASSVTAIPSSQRTIFKDIDLRFHDDLIITGTVKLKGSCLIDGFGNKLTLGANGVILIDHNSSLMLKNVAIDGVKNYNLRCVNNSGSLVLSNAQLLQSGNYTFSQGSISFQNDVLITGAYKFTYATLLSSTIESDAALFFDYGCTLSYAPFRARQDLIVMTNQTSSLCLNGCTLHSTRTGIHLSTGTLFLDDSVTMSSEAKNTAEALWIDQTLNVVVRSGAQVEFFGTVKYQ